MTIRRRVIDLLITSRCSAYFTATDICKGLNVPDGVSDFVGVELSSVSSALKKMYDAGELERLDGIGPRGGFGYRVK